MLIEKVIEAKQKKIRLLPTHVNRASEIGHPCLRYLVFRRTRWQEATLHDVAVQFLFDEGVIQERAVLRDLEDAGCVIIEQQRDYFWQNLQLSAHLDGKVLLDEKAEPLEVKSMSPFVWQKVATVKDLLESRLTHLQKYPAQITLYNLLSNSERGWLILKNKSTGQLKELEVPLDYAYAESLLKKCEAVNRHVAENTVPEPIPYSEPICGRCPFFHICLPDVKRDALDLTTDPELEAQLIRRHELAPLRAEYEEVDEQVKAVVREHEKVIVGDFLITGRWQDRKDGKKVWLTKIDRLQPVKGAEHG